MKNSKLISLLLALILVASLTISVLADGVENGNATLTRGTFVTELFKLRGAADTEKHQKGFDDVPEDGELAQAVRWAVDTNVANGYGNGKFGPNDPVTREQMATMFYRYAQNLGKGFTGAWMFNLDYPDAAEISDYANEAMHWVVMNRIIFGTEKGLEPKAFSTNSQLSLVLERWQNSLDANETSDMQYLVLVNKLNALPDDWESKLDTVTTVNSLGDTVEVEREAYNAYLALKEDLAENDSIYLELDSARRSIAEQQEIMNSFTEKYGADYAAKTVATPGYSEHHTGLALDLYFRLDGKDIYYNEDMIKYPEIWEKVHAKLANYGFILRYPEGKEHITGYGYEPWHIRYVGNAYIAKEIMSQPGLTLEVWLEAVNDPELTIDYGKSEIYTNEELNEAMVQIKCKFASFEGCELHGLRYAGDESCSEENIKWLNSLDEGKNYIQVVEFLSDFHTSADVKGAWEFDKEYKDYQWWLARTKDGGWQLLSWGY